MIIYTIIFIILIFLFIASPLESLLLLVAFILSLFLMPLGFFYGVIDSFYKRGYAEGKKRIKHFFKTFAISIDQTANVCCKELFNDFLIKKNGYKFGNPDETISGILGKNKLKKSLTVTGKILDFILEKIDPNHTIKSIEKDE